MSRKIRKAAVLGAGVMGAQIAAHLAAAGVRTYLLDLPGKEPPADPKLKKIVGKRVRSAPSILAIENLKRLKPAPLMTASVLPNIIPGNFEDDMSVLSECDWVIEAVIERIDVKKSIHEQINANVRPDVPVTTNTSGISLAEIIEDLPEEYGKRFFGTHFFNPPRYMRLLEMIPFDGCDKQLIQDMADFCRERLGKGVVYANDTVNFIANRIGVFANQSTLKHMGDMNLNVETVDFLTGPLIGRAKSATLRTMDVVGLDTFMAVAKNTIIKAPDDPYKEWFNGPKWIENLIEKGHLGQKTRDKGGCYKKVGRDILAYRKETESYEQTDVTTYSWVPEAKKIKNTVERLKFIINQDCDGARFVWYSLRDVMSYAALLLDQIADGKPLPVDQALSWGFNYEMGPFQTWQALGYDDLLARMKKENVPLPDWCAPGLKFYDMEPGSTDWILNGGPSAQFNTSLSRMEDLPKEEFKTPLLSRRCDDDKRTVIANEGASLMDLGDGIACLNFHTKMNTIGFEITDMMLKSVDKVNESFDGLVIANDGRVFSAGANLQLFLEDINAGNWERIDKLLREFQGAMLKIKYAPFPSVSCPFGMTLGGGCEVSLQTSRQLVAAETYAGLVEAGVGLIPAGGGTKELALRAYAKVHGVERGDPMTFIQHYFMLMGMAKVSASGIDAIEMGLYPETAQVVMSRDHHALRAKEWVRQMADLGYAAPLPPVVKAAGDPGIHTIRMTLHNMVEGHFISEHDALIGEKLATIMCGGEVDAGTPVSESQFLDLERRVFIELCQTEKTKERIAHMLKVGKPLRN